YPNLDDLAFDRSLDLPIDGDRLADYVLDHPRLLITGAERSGKTTLAKALYRVFRGKAMVPILVSGTALKSPEFDDVVRLTHRQAESQYGPAFIEQYKQLPLTSKVLIVDDLHKAPFNRTGR